MKIHLYSKQIIERSELYFGTKYWKYDVAKCGFRESYDLDRKQILEDVNKITCKKCLSYIK